VAEAAGGRFTVSSFSHFGLAMVTPDVSHDFTFHGPDSSGYADDCGIADLQPAYCSRMREKTVAHQGIFENDFATVQKLSIISSRYMISLMI
jgi:hypothetical protein